MRTYCFQPSALNRQLTTCLADRGSAEIFCLQRWRQNIPSSCISVRHPASDVYSTLMRGVWVLSPSDYFIAAAFLLLLSLNPSFHTCEMSVLLDTLWRKRGHLRRQGNTCWKPSLPEPSPRDPRTWTEGPSLTQNTNPLEIVPQPLPWCLIYIQTLNKDDLVAVAITLGFSE